MKVSQVITYAENTANMLNTIGNDRVLAVIPVIDHGNSRILIIYKDKEDTGNA